MTTENKKYDYKSYRKHEPYILTNERDGITEHIYYHNDDQDEQGHVETYQNGILTEVIFGYEGTMHREDGPAYIRFDEEENVIEEEYYVHGKPVNADILPLLFHEDKETREASRILLDYRL